MGKRGKADPSPSLSSLPVTSRNNSRFEVFIQLVGWKYRFTAAHLSSPSAAASKRLMMEGIPTAGDKRGGRNAT